MKLHLPLWVLAFYAFVLWACQRELPENKAPIVHTGNDTTLTLKGNPALEIIRLVGSATDNDGSVIGYLWSQVSGPNTSIIENAGLPSTDVSGLIPGIYVFQLMATDNNGATGVKKVKILVKVPADKELVLRAGPANAESCIVGTRQGSEINPLQTANANINTSSDIDASAWTYGAQGLGVGINRTYFNFAGLSILGSQTIVVSAKLSLYGIKTGMASAIAVGNSYYPGSPYLSFGNNACWLKNVNCPWNASSITWNNKPATSDKNRVAVPASTSQWNNDVLDLDVTLLVTDIITANKNFGFCLQQQDEQTYRSLSFCSSENADSTRRPKLVITYK